ncbi:hypothetical protein DEALK_05200 [Dehalogenimonas alkenigignens]|uniref:Uncharacterized protein n=1 Tax=Dehalogenimonas alkenigignens TaxID=1217799 RepID=A0A0W0GGJ6_9CHLR|nr:hypothetical protein DEALK_05200 [Dehalogenimonas alkenigignens]
MPGGSVELGKTIHRIMVTGCPEAGKKAAGEDAVPPPIQPLETSGCARMRLGV